MRGAACAPPLHSPMWEHSSHTLRERALRPAPRPTFSRRESRQRYARNLLVPGPPAQGGGPPWIPPAFNPSGIGCGSLNLQASSVATPPSHGLKIESVISVKLREKNKAGLPTSSKWQIRLGQWQKVARRDAQRARKGRCPHTGGFQRAQPLEILW